MEKILPRYYKEGEEIILSQVIYEPQQQIALLKKHASSFLHPSGLGSTIAEQAPDFDEAVRELHRSDAKWNLLAVVHDVKHPSFSEEREWRLVHRWWPVYSEDYDSDDLDGVVDRAPISRPPKRNFRCSHNKIVSYTELDFGSVADLISEIIVGPRNETPEATMMALLFELQLFDVKLSSSSSPFR